MEFFNLSYKSKLVSLDTTPKLEKALMLSTLKCPIESSSHSITVCAAAIYSGPVSSATIKISI